MILTQRDLEHAHCENRHCTEAHHGIGELWMHPRCHQGSALLVKYEGGLLHLFCALCDQPVGIIAVAKALM